MRRRLTKIRKVLKKILGVILVALLMPSAMASLPGTVNADVTLPTPEMLSPGTDTAADVLSGTQTVSAVPAPSHTAWSETYGGESTNYAAVGEVTLTVDVTTTDRGNTSPAPGTYTCTQGATVSVTAIPSTTDNVLAFWLLDGSYSGTTNPITVTMDRSHHLEAYFNSKPTLYVYKGNAGSSESGGWEGNTVPAFGEYTYNFGDSVSVTAVPEVSGNSFQGWVLDGRTFRAENPITVTMDKSHFLGAWFNRQPVLYVYGGGIEGTIVHDPFYPISFGDTFSLTAIPSAGYTFYGWSTGTGELVRQNPITITMNGYYSLAALFSPSDNPPGLIGGLYIRETTGGTTAPAYGTYPYNYGTTVSVTATPDWGYTFEGWWLNGFHLAQNPITVTVQETEILVPIFGVHPWGYVSATSRGITNPVPGTYIYNYGDTVTLIATPTAGYNFSYWQTVADGNYWAQNPITVTMDSLWEWHIQAVFTPQTLQTVTLTLYVHEGSADGTPLSGVQVTGQDADGVSFNQTTDASGFVTITGAPGMWHFSAAREVYRTNTWSQTISETSTKHAYLTKQYTLTVAVSPAEGGNTSPYPGTYTYDEVTQVTITASANTGYRFTGWSGDATGTSTSATVTMNSDKSVTANFIRQYTLTVAVSPSEGGNTSPYPGTYTYDEGTAVNITTTPASGWSFAGWSGDASGSANPITVTMNSNKTVTANFTQTPVTYALTISVVGNGTTSPVAGTYNYASGMAVQITATPSAGWVFSHWSGDANGTSNPINTTMSSNKNVTANFALQGVTLISVIKQNPTAYQGQTVKVSGAYRGWESGHGPPPVTRSDWVLLDTTGSMYVTGGSLTLRYPADIGTPVEVTGIVSIKDGVPYIEVPRSGLR